MTDTKYPEPAVGALIINPDKKVFLMTSPKWHGKYIVPGGHVELGETMKEALKREIKEETNLNIFDINFISASDHISPNQNILSSWIIGVKQKKTL